MIPESVHQAYSSKPGRATAWFCRWENLMKCPTPIQREDSKTASAMKTASDRPFTPPFNTNHRLSSGIVPIVALILLRLPVMSGTINTFTGTVDNLTGTNDNYSLNSAPINGTAAGSYKDLLFTGTQLNLLQTNTNYHTESISVTNGASYGIAGASNNAPTIRVGSTGSTAEVIAAFNNANVPSGAGTGSQDLIYLGGNSNLSISNLNNNASTAPLTVQLRQSGNFNIQAGSILTLDAAVRQNGTASLTLTGGGRTNLNGVNTYAGSTVVNGGILAIGVNGAINSSSGVTIAAGAQLVYNSNTALTKAPVLNGSGASSRAILAGSGTVNAAVSLDNLGDTLAPGNSPGMLTFTPAQTWNSFSMDWEVNNFTGTTAGVDFDQLSLAGSLDLTGGSASYLLNVLSLTGSNTPGAVPNFAENSQNWNILTAAGGISGFNAASWTLNTGSFAAANAATGAFSLAQSGNHLVLSYIPVPEPSSWGMAAGGLGFLILGRRKRTQRLS